MDRAENTVSVCIMAQNAEKYLRRCLDSCVWANEIVLVDGGSTDSTADVAREYDAQVYTRPFDYFAHQRNYTLARANCTWTLSLDSDEQVSPELAEEIQQLLAAGSPPYNIYRVPRKLIDHGCWLRSEYPDYQVCFFRTGHTVRALGRMHNPAVLNEPCGKLSNAILHYSFDDLADHIDRMNRYTTLSALDKYERGRRPGLAYLLARFHLTFWQEYLLRGRIREGVPGLMYSVVRATEVFAKYAKVWELADGTSSVDIEAERARKQEADRDILADERQPDLIRDVSQTE
ncbi:MAG: glycosyltransferase family 2 protein [Armatimonadetes bacterium]|nr:glycosyltransferase family 2 protein [Armatimonadota bacterium]